MPLTIPHSFSSMTTASSADVNENFTAVKDYVNASTFANPMDSAGDMIVGGASGAAAKLDAGTTGYILQAKGAAAPEWTNATSIPIGLKGIVDASDATAGNLGQVISFSASISSDIAWRRTDTGVDLTAGMWLVFARFRAAATSGMTGAYTMLSSVDANDGHAGSFGLTQTNGYCTTGSELDFPLKTYLINTSSTIRIIVKAHMLGAAPNPTVSGFAVRIR